ncbi:F-box/FBD/LRR-repeat protein At4g26340-like [Quercus robur]|uniref:F-box/FBD/LRR-repeat protein At4g26340-like n=1 Tax=Quercus robur TaxID=38942 RepID=UPI002163C729|nr:F-box/FBD/LRR-repeat protein At4g26340-like [Quercus robur]
MVGSMKVQKKQRIERDEDKDEDDIISSLPDCLLTGILSYLPIRDSVATSVLSSRWRPLWTLVTILHLDQNKTSTTSDHTSSFTEIVSRIFILRNTVPNPAPIHELHIRWHKNCLPLHVDTWIHATFRHSVKELDLSINTHPNQPLELPQSFYFCSTLRVLRLSGDILLNPPPQAS